MRPRGNLAWSWGLLRTAVINLMILGGIGLLQCILSRRSRRPIRFWKRLGMAVSALMGFWRWVIGRRWQRLMWLADWEGLTTIRRRWRLAVANCGCARCFAMRGCWCRGF